MQRYDPIWEPSVSSFAGSQDVVAKINGVEIPVAECFPSTAGECVTLLDNDADVEWWVVTHSADNSRTVASEHSRFIAKSGAPAEPFLPATGLGQLWLNGV